MLKRMAYLGPPGTFCEEAAQIYNKEQIYELVPRPTIAAVFSAIDKGDVEAGIVPIENSCEGAVNQTLHLLSSGYTLQISAEIILPVKHSLLARPGLKPAQITHILSHYQALAQCRDYLAANFPDAELLDVPSTSEAARRVAASPQPWAAIGTMRAARTCGLDILSPCIQDQNNNETRFVLLAREDAPYCAPAKTSLLVYILDRPGALFELLREFYIRNINLTRIESRPARTRLGDYLFFIDVEGHRHDEPIRSALHALRGITAAVHVLGSYPRCQV
jgi:prephenate dehydratase